MASHMKRLAAPNSWPIKTKGITFTIRPAGSGSAQDLSLPLVIALRDVLGIASSSKEVKQILHTHEIRVDGRRVHDHDASVDLFGVLTTPEGSYRLTINTKNKLALIPLTGEEAQQRPCRIDGKTILSQGRVQLNCSSGRNIIVDKDEYKTADTILLDLKKGGVAKRLPFEKGCLVFLYRGAHAGHLANVEEVKGKNILLKADDGKQFETRRGYCFVVGSDKPVFKVN